MFCHPCLRCFTVNFGFRHAISIVLIISVLRVSLTVSFVIIIARRCLEIWKRERERESERERKRERERERERVGETE